MPRRLILSSAERVSLSAFPDNREDFIKHYTLSKSDLDFIFEHRGRANRIGIAVQLCLLKYPGYALSIGMVVPEPVINWIAEQLQIEPNFWFKYSERDVTRREHLQELCRYLNIKTYGISEAGYLIKNLTEYATQTDKGLTLATQAMDLLRQERVIIPSLNVIERACAEAVTLANRRIYEILIEPLTAQHKKQLDNLLTLKPGTGFTWLVWLRQSPLKPNSKYLLEQIERLKTLQAINLPDNIGRHVHQNRLLKLTREGGQMAPNDLAAVKALGVVDYELLAYLSPLGWEHINLNGDYVWEKEVLKKGQFRSLRGG